MTGTDVRAGSCRYLLNQQTLIRDNCDEYIDFNEIFDLKIDDFVDCDHLSDKGAKKLSKII